MFLDIIGDFLNGLNGNAFLNLIMGFLSIIPKFLYFLFTCLTSVVDLFQVVFRKLAGLDPIMISGEVTTGDSIYKILMDALFGGKYPAISTLFWSLIVLGVFMLIVTTIIATIRIEYNPDKDKGNSKSGIIKNFFKALFSFAIVPIACVFGMVISNMAVYAINSATTVQGSELDDTYQYFDQWSGTITDNELIQGDVNSNELLQASKPTYYSYNIFGITVPTTAEPFSGFVFRASAYSSNRFRKHGAEYLLQVNNSGVTLGGMFGKDSKLTESSVAADIIDTAFAINAKMKGSSSTVKYSISSDAKNFISDDYYLEGLPLFSSTNNLTWFSRYNVELVWFFYDLWSFNLIIGFVAVLILSKLYFNFCLQLMGRVFELAGLFMLSPIVISIIPIDNGAALGRWRLSFVAKVGLLVVLVFGLNIVSPLLSIVQGIKLFGIALVDYIITTLFIVAALTALSGLMDSVSKILFDKSSAYDGGKFGEQVAGNFKEGATKAAGFVGGSARTVGKVAGTGLTFGRFMGREMVHGAHSLESSINKGRERAAIRDQIRSNQRSIDDYYANMSYTGRNDELEGFFQTAAGKDYVKRVGSEQAAKNALLYDGRKNYTGKKTSFDLTDAERDAFKNYLFEEHNFAQSAEASKYAKGTADYADAVGRYMNLSTEKKIDMFEGGSPLTARQAKAQRARAQAAKSYGQRFSETKLVSKFTDSGFGRGLKSAKDVVLRGAKSAANVIGRTAAKGADAVNEAAGALKNGTSSIYGTDTFTQPASTLFTGKQPGKK